MKVEVYIGRNVSESYINIDGRKVDGITSFKAGVDTKGHTFVKIEAQAEVLIQGEFREDEVLRVVKMKEVT